MIKHLSRFMIVLWLSVAILTISLFPKNVLADCDSRAYGRFDLYHTATNRYTAVQATIEIAYPTVRDGVLSSEVIWMWGDTLAHSVEMGWRRIPGLYGSNPFAYIG